MKLYLVQHGEAASEAEDPARPLTPAGRAAVENAGRHLARVSLLGSGAAVRHSGKLRAAQTAEILCSCLRSAGPAEALAGLAPNDPPEAAQKFIAQSIGQNIGDLMLVGHLPHLSRLASLLLAGTWERTLVRFRMGGVVCLARDDSGAWALEWMLVPELAVPTAAS